jgi:GntR family transcriptional regulator
MNRPDDVSLFAGGPLYREVKRRITDSLGSGEWKPGEAIPAEPRLAARFGVSIGTLRKAIDELVAENVLLRQQGRGTFVASHRGEAMRFLFFSIVGQDGSHHYPEVRLEAFRRAKAGEAVAASLGIAAKSPVIEFRNSLWLDDEPVGVDDITVPVAVFPGLTLARLRDRANTVYHLYEHGFDVSVMRVSEGLRAAAAPADVAALLRLPEGAALLQVDRVAYTLDDRPVEFRLSWVNTARHEYRRD